MSLPICICSTKMISAFRSFSLEINQFSILVRTLRRFSSLSSQNEQSQEEQNFNEQKRHRQKRFEFVLTNERLTTIPNLLSAGRFF